MYIIKQKNNDSENLFYAETQKEADEILLKLNINNNSNFYYEKINKYGEEDLFKIYVGTNFTYANEMIQKKGYTLLYEDYINNATCDLDLSNKKSVVYYNKEATEGYLLTVEYFWKNLIHKKDLYVTRYRKINITNKDIERYMKMMKYEFIGYRNFPDDINIRADRYKYINYIYNLKEKKIENIFIGTVTEEDAIKILNNGLALELKRVEISQLGRED